MIQSNITGALMTVRFAKIGLVFFISQLVLACDTKATDVSSEASVAKADDATKQHTLQPRVTVKNITNLTDEEKLMLINYIPIGATYQQIKTIFPQLTELRLEARGSGDQSSWLYDATTPWTIFAKSAQVEFNFKAGYMYSFGTCINHMSLSEARTYYKNIQVFFSQHLGQAKEEGETEMGFAAVSSYWYADDFFLSLTNNINQNKYSDLCWGFQPAIQH